MSVNKMMQAYTKSDHQTVAESNDPVAIVALLFDELIRAMQDFITHSDKDTGKKRNPIPAIQPLPYYYLRIAIESQF